MAQPKNSILGAEENLSSRRHPADFKQQEKGTQSEQYYRFLFEKNPMPAWIFDLETLCFLEVNEAAISFYGYTKQEFLSMTIEDIRPTDEIDLLHEDINSIRAHGESFDRTWRHQKKNGELIYAEVKANDFIYDNKRNRLVMITDVTAILEAEDSLRKRNEQYRLANNRFYLASQATSDIIWEWDILDGKIEWSENFQKILGHLLPADSTVSQEYCSGLLHPEDRERVLKQLDKTISNSEEKKWECEFRFRKVDGSYAYVEDKGYVIRDDKGKAVRMIGAMHDYSEQKYQSDLQSLELKVFSISSTPGIAFSEVVVNLLRGIEATHTEMLTSVLLLMNDRTVRHLAAPRLPAQYIQLINGMAIGPSNGSCGTAMHRKEAVIVSDIDHDPLWVPYRSITQNFGLKACWSVPIIHGNGTVMGSFAIYYKETKSPTEKEWNTVLRVCNLIRLLMENNVSLEQMKLTNERYDIVTNATHDLIWDWNLETNELYRDPKGLLKVYGFANNEPIRNINAWLERIHPDDLSKVQKTVFNIINATDQNIFDVEYRFKKENGEYAAIYDRGYILRTSEGKAYRMIGAAQDITERKKLERELLNQQKAISQATLTTQEKERTEISKELHDNVNQVLTTTKLYLDLAMTNPELRDDLIAKSSKNIINVITEIRHLSSSLMTPSLGDLGLVDSLDDLVENLNATKTITAIFTCEGIGEELFDESQKLALFRIAQEALNNVLKHSGATQVVIKLLSRGKVLQLTVKDNGQGFDSASIKKGTGLTNINNRVYLLNGNLSIDTQPGKGCTLVVELPLHVFNHFDS